MPADSNSVDGTQAVSSTSPLAGDPPAPAADAQQPQTGSADAEGSSGLDATALTRELAAARREAANYRTRLKSYEDRDKSELDKATDRIAELERQNAELVARSQESTVRMAVLDAATRLGFRSPELAYRALEREAIEFRDDGQPRNVEKLLKELLEREPYLGKPGTDFGGGPRGTQPQSQPTMNELLRAARSG